MRIVDWAEFQTLPPGTIFQEYVPHILGCLEVLGSVLEPHRKDEAPNDYTSCELTPCARGSDYFSRYPGIPIGPSMVIFTPSNFGRYACYDCKDKHWLVWEKEDRERLARWLLDPEQAVGEQNDEPQALISVDI